MIKFNSTQQPKVSAVGKISLSKPRLHKDQIAPVHYLIYVVSGTFHVSEDGEQYTVKEGHVFFRETGKHHYSHTYMAPGTEWYWVSFEMPTSSISEDIFTLPKHMTVTHQQDLFHRLETMLHLQGSSNPYKEPHLSSELSSIFYTLLAEPNHPPTANELIVQKVNAILNLMIYEKFSANAIAAKINLDYSYTGKCYKAITGTTINQHFNHLKIQRAIKMMEEGSDNMTLISEALGYPNPFYFSRIFKKNTGLSPRDYLKQIY